MLPLAVAALSLVPIPADWSPIEDELSTEQMQKGLAEVSGRVTRDELEKSLAIIDPRHQLDPFIAIGERSLSVYRRAGRNDLIIEVMLRTTPAKQPPSRTLVIDPGHWGGTWSALEQRHVTVAGGAPVREGDITLSTALRVRAKVPEVRLTRTRIASGDFPENTRPEYDARRESRISVSESHGTTLPWPTLADAIRLWPYRHQQEPFPLYTHYDLRARDMGVHDDEAFVSIHYNVASADQTNGIMAFVYGNALDGELMNVSQRYWAIRHALDGYLPASIELATAFARAMQRRMALPALAPSHRDDKANKIVLDELAGVHARNLAVLRRAPGVAVLLEGPCMNAGEEYHRFISERISVDGVAIPARAEEYADAIADVARQFFANSRGRP
jgi:N-acetylmuramoyl-L-alanine amidase